MSAIEQCRSAALGGHVLRCDSLRAGRRSPTTPAAIGIARSARPAPRAAGSRRDRPTCCRWTITTWCSPCRRRSAPSPTTTRQLIYDLLFEVAARDAAHHRRRPEASRGADRCDPGPAYLGLGADAPSACAWHRSRRWPRSRRCALGRLQAGLLPAGARALAPVPPPLPRRTGQCASQRPAAVLR